MKYSEDYELIEMVVGGVSFGHIYNIYILGPQELSLADYINKNILPADDARLGKTISKNNILVDEKEAIKFEGEIVGSMDGPWTYGIDVFILRKSYIYRVTYSSGKTIKEVSSDEIKIFNQMLSTFRFIEKETLTTPSINILFPNGGEILKVGESRLISWNCSNVATAELYYIARLFLLMDKKILHGTIDGTPQAYNQIVGCPTDGGKFLWEVGRVTRGTILPGDNYQVKIELIEVGDGGEQIITSDISDNYFSIVE